MKIFFQSRFVLVTFLLSCPPPTDFFFVTGQEVNLVSVRLGNDDSSVQILGTATEDGLVDAFLGIQYAESNGRFSRSTLLDPKIEDVALEATSFGPHCPQPPSELFRFSSDAEEDCLYLNVWRPSGTLSQGSDLAVMMWIHGGGFEIGGGEVNQGHLIARNQGVIVVSINYRLGALGFLPQDESGFGALNGIYDQVIALQWINRYIPYFGGDPNRVTVFGTSAGSESACMLGVSPLARGLFRGLILQSGECMNNARGYGIPTDDIALGLNLVKDLLNATGAEDMVALKDAARFPAEDVITISTQVGWPLTTIDREVLPEHPRILYNNADSIVPQYIMVGANSEDLVLASDVSPFQFLGLAADTEGYIRGVIGPAYGEDAAVSAAAAYSPSSNLYNGDALRAFVQFNGDYNILCPARVFAANVQPRVSAGGGAVYLYHFAHFGAGDALVLFGMAALVDVTSGWASHAAEVPFVFGYDLNLVANQALGNWTEEDYTLSSEIQSRWANFAKTGSPNGEELEEVWTDVVASSGEETNKNSIDGLATFQFLAGSGKMRGLQDKAEQCTVFPYQNSSSSAPEEVSKSEGTSPPTTDPPTVTPTEEDRIPSSSPFLSRGGKSLGMNSLIAAGAAAYLWNM